MKKTYLTDEEIDSLFEHIVAIENRMRDMSDGFRKIVAMVAARRHPECYPPRKEVHHPPFERLNDPYPKMIERGA